ncbi:uncharacterized protein LOC124555512 [Schistocerca americana]|uniref:uncharacterized protein LOC124555512 n=1 Tax=Schistocerca americana TaxID=7009 RepID=UPI001F50055F|nr:uncharacterized protein LOC124555512 [Schistocerca americana]XP_049953718.1 uncharacterized protein LOC126470148 [Schistocerca serialis cubense]
MLKLKAVLLLTLVGVTMSQYQSFYAGNGWPPQPAASDDGIGNRVGEAPGKAQSPDDLIASRVGAWPEERQPFWKLNWDQIQKHIGRPQPEPQRKSAAPAQQQVGRP